MLAKSIHAPVIADEDNLAIQIIVYVRRFVYDYWRLTGLYDVYRDVVHSAQGHNLGFTSPGGGVPY